MKDILKRKLTRFRGTTSRGLKDGGRVVRDGGENEAGMIAGVSVITAGEALGHEMWLDNKFLQDITTAINATGARGIKSRFTHPDMSSDGLGSFLGRFSNAYKSYRQVFADLHFAGSAHRTPDGDLASYVMDLAENDPDMFGASIVFRRDVEAEDEFVLANQDRRGKFKSPDTENAENLPHARLAEIRAADVVDEPAANPGGAFHRGSGVLDEADALLSYATGLSNQEPELVSLEFDPLRVRSWLAKWLSRNGMKITHAGTPALAGLPSIDELGMSVDDIDHRDPKSILKWCQEQESKDAMRRIDDAVRSVEGHEQELRDRRRYG